MSQYFKDMFRPASAAPAAASAGLAGSAATAFFADGGGGGGGARDGRPALSTESREVMALGLRALGDRAQRNPADEAAWVMTLTSGETPEAQAFRANHPVTEQSTLAAPRASLSTAAPSRASAGSAAVAGPPSAGASRASARSGTGTAALTQSRLAPLDPGFSEEGFDAFAFALQGCPEAAIEGQDAFILERLAHLRGHLERTDTELLRVVHEHQGTLVEGMRVVNDVDLGLVRASINVKNARRRLALARDGLVVGDLAVVQLHRRRARAKALMTMLIAVDELVRRRRVVQEVADSGDVPAAVEACIETLRALEAHDPGGDANEPAQSSRQPHQQGQQRGTKLLAIEELKEAMVAFLPMLRRRADATLQQLLFARGAFDRPAYARVVQSYVSLDRAIAQCVPRSSQAGSTAGGTDGIQGLATRAQRAAIALAEEAIKEQLVAFLHDVEDKLARKASGGARTTTAMSTAAAVTASGLTEARAKKLSLKEICDDMSAREPVRPTLVRRVGMALATVCEVIHNYHALERWHAELVEQLPDDARVAAAPFSVPAALTSSRAAAGAPFAVPVALMSSGQGRAEDPAGSAGASVATAALPLPAALPAAPPVALQVNPPPPSLPFVPPAALHPRLRMIAADIVSGRRTVSSGVLSHVATLCKSPLMRYPNLRLSSFVLVVKLLGVLAESLGNFGAGSDGSRRGASVPSGAGGDNAALLEARAFVRQVCRDYLRDFSKDHVEGLNSFMSRELWAVIPLTLAALGGSRALMQRGTAKHLLRSKSAEEDEAAVESAALETARLHQGEQQQQQSQRANPFSGLLRLEPSAPDGEEEEVDGGVAEEAQEPASPALDSGLTTSSVQPSGEEQAGEFVLTTSSVGLAKDIGAYVLLMQRVPSLASEALQNGLQRLALIYCYNVLTNLVPAALLYQLFEQPQSCLALQFNELRAAAAEVQAELRCGALSVLLPAAGVEGAEATSPGAGGGGGSAGAFGGGVLGSSGVLSGISVGSSGGGGGGSGAGGLGSSGSGALPSTSAIKSAAARSFSLLGQSTSRLGARRPSQSDLPGVPPSPATPGLPAEPRSPPQSSYRRESIDVGSLTATRIPGRAVTMLGAEPLEQGGKVASLLETAQQQQADSDEARAALATRAVAAESVALVAFLLRSVRPQVELALPAVERAELCERTFGRVERSAVQLRRLLYRGAARGLVNRFGVDAFASHGAAAQAAAQAQASPQTNVADLLLSGELRFGMSGGKSEEEYPGGGDPFGRGGPLERQRGSISRMIVDGVQWARVRQLQSEASPYVVRVALRLRKVWAHLQRESREGQAFPLKSIGELWAAAVEESLDQMLDGFASVRQCSTEGRALMSLDLHTLYRGLEEVAPASPPVQAARLRVDGFVKAFYYDRDRDVLEWIAANKARYELWHLRNLAAFGVGAQLKKEPLRRLLDQVDRIYVTAG